MALVEGATIRTLDGSVHAAWSDASRGDLRPIGHGPGGQGPEGHGPEGHSPGDASALTRFAADLAEATSTGIGDVAWVTQVHGSDVVVVDRPPGTSGVLCRNLGEHDALVTASAGTALCVLTADCAPIALSSPEGICGAVHAGWRGLAAGVVEAAVAAMGTLGATGVTAALGPCIHAPCYAFAPVDLAPVEAAYGPTVRGTTTDGRPALDLVAGVTAAVTGAGARMADGVDACTACGVGHFSHRARADTGRQAMLVWAAAPGTGS